MKHLTKEPQRWFVFLCILLLCIFFVGAHAQKQAQKDADFYLSVYAGYVAVFTEGSDEPVTVLETKIASLPEREAERLKNGIAAENAEALQRLIEDYCS